jgi:hypothetical protein
MRELRRQASSRVEQIERDQHVEDVAGSRNQASKFGLEKVPDISTIPGRDRIRRGDCATLRRHKPIEHALVLPAVD